MPKTGRERTGMWEERRRITPVALSTAATLGRRCESLVAQWGWFLPGVDERRIGFEPGPYTWWRERRHRRLQRPVSICLLEHPRGVDDFGRLMAFWISERSSACVARVNEGVETADVLWVHSQDPLTEATRASLLAALSRARRGAAVVNHPRVYDAYHRPDCFDRLEAAGVDVPRSTWSEDDLGRVEVVYKRSGQQGATKERALYAGPRPGFRAFEYVDGRDATGLHRRYRAFYVAGLVRPSKVMVSEHWNVCLRHAAWLEPTFDLRPDEQRQVGTIASTLGLDYFAVDFVRHGLDAAPVFLDVNVYPRVRALDETSRQAGHVGRWHTFDTRSRLGIPEPAGRPFWELFDEAVLDLVAASAGSRREH